MELTGLIFSENYVLYSGEKKKVFVLLNHLCLGGAAETKAMRFSGVVCLSSLSVGHL